MKRTMSAVLVASAVSLAAANDDPDILLLHTPGGGNVHCYRIVEAEGQPATEIQLGATWDGHPITTKTSLEVTQLPPGWTSEIVQKPRYDYQYAVLKNEISDTGAAKAGLGQVGSVCLRLGANIQGMEKLPYAYERVGSSRLESARARPDKGAALEAVMESVKDAKSVRESVDDAEDVVNDVQDLLN